MSEPVDAARLARQQMVEENEVWQSGLDSP